MRTITDVTGQAWKVLSERDEVTVPELARLLNVKDAVANEALGWLGSEGKVCYRMMDGRTFVSLTEGKARAPHRQFELETAASQSFGHFG